MALLSSNWIWSQLESASLLSYEIETNRNCERRLTSLRVWRWSVTCSKATVVSVAHLSAASQLVKSRRTAPRATRTPSPHPPRPTHTTRLFHSAR